MRNLPICILIALAFGCNSDNSISSSRSIERLIVGTWVDPTETFVEDFGAWVSIIFKADGTFIAPWGLTGNQLKEYQGPQNQSDEIPARAYQGTYISDGNFIGARGLGTGDIEAEFVRIERTEVTGPPASGIGLIITEVKNAYIETQLGLNLENIASGKIFDVLSKLNKASLPAEALGVPRTYLKIEQMPFSPWGFGPPGS